jgi:hypothetical protein
MGGLREPAGSPLQYILQYVLQYILPYVLQYVLQYCGTAVLRYCSTAVLRGGEPAGSRSPPPDPAGIGRLPGRPGQGSRLAPGPQGPALPKPLSPAELRGAKRQYVLWAPPPRLRWQFCHLKPYFVT